MKKKLLSLTLSLLLLGSTGVIASAKTIPQQTNKATAAIQLAKHTHGWILYSKTVTSVSTENDGPKHRTVTYYKTLYVCPECGAQQTGYTYEYGSWVYN